jgi:hypothetical protein
MFQARFTGEAGDLRQARGRHCDRQRTLRRPMQGADHSTELDLVGELDLVDEEADAPRLAARRLSQCHEQVGQLASQHRLVRAFDVERDLDSLGAGHLDRRQVGKAIADTGRDAPSEIEPAERNLRVQSQLPQHPGLGRQLVVVGQEPLCLSAILEGVERPARAAGREPAFGV